MTYYDQFKENIVLPQAILTHILAIFPSLSSFNVWLYFYGDESLAPSQIAATLQLTTADVNQLITRLGEADVLNAEFDETTGDMRFDTRPAFAKLDAILASEGADSLAEDVVELSDISRLIAAFEPEMPGGLTPINIEELQKWLSEDKFDATLILQALREAALNRKVSLPYIRAILRNWRSDGIVTARDIEDNREEREIIKGAQQSDSAPLSEDYFNSVDSLRKMWGYDRAE
ncbi:DnaD domain-containing protein [Lactococcus piscium]|uniref:Replication protein DnaD family protein n=1 Tax=Pseudolactococcus piscium MKFS47 TaxID=297352 RepID=A0A0D6DWZ2_9LACT|nr:MULTISPECIES: DnaD domain-containing protein [Lactococcus]MCJ2000445.1 DnaD domain-containing protein [Lactococcus carnosus]CEN28247.1 Replication protein DnaD family protein [Lactococcus piscium MKFS47]